MSVDTWDPSQSKDLPAEPSPQTLQRFIAFGRSTANGALAHDLDASEVKRLAECARLDASRWRALGRDLPDEDIMDLMRFFTVAEQVLPGWEAQDQSSVIGLNRLLRSRGRKLDRQFLVWIKQHSRNRFLPNGPLG